MDTIEDVKKKPKKKSDLLRPNQFQIRLNDDEIQKLRLRAKEVNLSMVEYARCLIFDYPFEKSWNPTRRQKPKALRGKSFISKAEQEKAAAAPTVPTLPAQ